MKFSQADFLIFSRVTFYCSRVNILKFQGIFFISDREMIFFCMGTEFSFFLSNLLFFAGRIFCPRAVFKNFSWEVTILLEQKIENFLINFFSPGLKKHCPPEGDRERRS